MICNRSDKPHNGLGMCTGCLFPRVSASDLNPAKA
jgi:hypothetical protein